MNISADNTSAGNKVTQHLEMLKTKVFNRCDSHTQYWRSNSIYTWTAHLACYNYMLHYIVLMHKGMSPIYPSPAHYISTMIQIHTYTCTHALAHTHTHPRTHTYVHMHAQTLHTHIHTYYNTSECLPGFNIRLQLSHRRQLGCQSWPSEDLRSANQQNKVE